MRWIAPALLSLAASVASAEAGGFCAVLDEGLSAGTGLRAVTLPGFGEVACKRSLGLSGARSLNCAWPFAYRVAEARAAFEALSADVENCAVPARAPAPGVNHPDSYDLRLYSYQGGAVAVSLKDKAALRETYVFLRMETVPE